MEAFETLDIRVGTIVDAQFCPEARKPAYRLRVDFGDDVGIRQSSAQITIRYAVEELVGRRVLGVVNLPPRRIAGFVSEALVLGVNDRDGNVVLIRPEFSDVANGARLY